LGFCPSPDAHVLYPTQKTPRGTKHATTTTDSWRFKTTVNLANMRRVKLSLWMLVLDSIIYTVESNKVAPLRIVSPPSCQFRNPASRVWLDPRLAICRLSFKSPRCSAGFACQFLLPVGRSPRPSAAFAPVFKLPYLRTCNLRSFSRVHGSKDCAWLYLSASFAAINKRDSAQNLLEEKISSHSS
jgi:hypothetical protein